ncbi:hypothetical protein CYMTET_2893 [Cymbomonas tetramitiformis]|uniref:Uncharacterized protein n=1 Tax=Cymbomonas tetramitiformis TaxID=36881 RepID=A0AAE0H4D4_9CHLO|nr:hypothetical protein CYMTET_2893 [Cymbomonas tetramitiformis]
MGGRNKTSFRKRAPAPKVSQPAAAEAAVVDPNPTADPTDQSEPTQTAAQQPTSTPTARTIQPSSRLSRRFEVLKGQLATSKYSFKKVAEDNEDLKRQLAEQRQELRRRQKLISYYKGMYCQPCEPTRTEKRFTYNVRTIRGAYSGTDPAAKERRVQQYSSDIVRFLKQQFPDKEHVEEALLKTICRQEYRAVLRKAVKVCKEIKMEIEEALVNEIESHWTAELGLAFRLRLHLSEGKYQYLINHLSCLYSDKEDKCVRIRVGSGVKMPSFRTHASKQKTVTLMEEYFQDMDPQILEEDEKTITVSLTKVLQGHLQQYPLPEGQTDLLIKIDGDGAPVMPRVNHTCVAVKCMRNFDDCCEHVDWEGMNSPFTSHSVLLYDGKEDWEVIVKQAKRLRQELDELQQDGGKLKYTKRKRLDLLEYAHLHHDKLVCPFECLGCKKVFNDPQALRAEAEPSTKQDRLKFQLEHFGVGWHKSNVWGISPEDLVADLLHFDLREVHFMLERTCKRYLLTTEQADSYCQFLADHAGCFIKVKKTSKKQGGKKIKVKKAARVRGLAMDYMDAKLDLGSGDQDGTLYSHIAYWHFPEQILRHGDLVDLSTQALEHLH